MSGIGELERRATREELEAEGLSLPVIQRFLGAVATTPEAMVQQGLEVNHELAARLLGGRATDMYKLFPDTVDSAQ